MVDEAVSKTVAQKACGFESHHPYQNETPVPVIGTGVFLYLSMIAAVILFA